MVIIIFIIIKIFTQILFLIIINDHLIGNRITGNIKKYHSKQYFIKIIMDKKKILIFIYSFLYKGFKYLKR